MTDWHKMRSSFENKHNSSELSVETSCEMSDSFHIFTGNLSPIPASMVPRKLDFSDLDEDDMLRDIAPAPASQSPPYRRVRALRLFDSPHTPKTLIEKCSTPSYHPPRSRLLRPPKINLQSDMPSGSSHHLHPPSGDEDSALGSLPPDDIDESRLAPPRRPVANINPFTPDGQALNKKKRALSKTPTWDSTPEQPAKRLRESNISRYKKEFDEVEEIGRGQFGLVTKCLNRLDGCEYALKRSITPVAGSAAERLALREVFAHAALGKHANVVRYYSAWAEDDHMIIQNEYCNGGSLQQRLENDGALPETELLLVLQHIASGLAYIHSQQLVHMDVKPANIFICSGGENTHTDEHDSDDGYGDDAHTHNSTNTYKIGDLGHVTCVSSPSREEGDCRYLAKEVLQEDFTHLTKADIFSLGLTLFEAARGIPLPKNGQEWHDYRDGKLPDLPNSYSREFNQLLKKMVDPDPTNRPSASSLLRHRLLRPAGDISLLQMRQELLALKMKNEMLTKELQEATRYIKSLTPNKLPSQTDSLKYRTRSSKRLQKPRDKLSDMSPIRFNRSDRRIKPEHNDSMFNNRQIRADRAKRI